MNAQPSLERTHQVSLQLLAGSGPGGQPVLEKLEAWALEAADCYELMHSPLFVRNLAAGDVFKLERRLPGSFCVLRRSGKLAIRVFRKSGIEELAAELTPEVEKLDGSLDRASERALVYSLHVNIGFSAIEVLFDRFMGAYPGTVWYYGNVYDPADGTTPLNWWNAFLNQV